MQSMLRLSLCLAQMARIRNEYRYIKEIVHVRSFGYKDCAKGWGED